LHRAERERRERAAAIDGFRRTRARPRSANGPRSRARARRHGRTRLGSAASAGLTAGPYSPAALKSADASHVASAAPERPPFAARWPSVGARA
jgi:hypothetical protein